MSVLTYASDWNLYGTMSRDWQWQPTLTFHDPDQPPIRLEDGPVSAFDTYGGVILHPWRLHRTEFYPHYAFFPQDFDAPAPPVEHTYPGIVFPPWARRRTKFHPHYSFFPQDFTAPTPDEPGYTGIIVHPWAVRRTRFHPHYTFTPQDFDAPTPFEPGYTGIILPPWALRQTKFYPYYAYRQTDDGAPSDDFDGRVLILHPKDVRPWKFLPRYLYPATDVEVAAPEVDTPVIWIPEWREGKFVRYYPYYISAPTDEAPVVVVDEGGLVTFLRKWDEGWYRPVDLLFPGFAQDESTVVIEITKPVHPYFVPDHGRGSGGVPPGASSRRPRARVR